MKFLQKLILPLLLAIVIFLIYSIYFSSKKGLGSFSDFNTNNSANKDIKVEIIRNKEIKKDFQNKTVTFYVRDKNGKVEIVQAPLPLPEDFDKAKDIYLRGHLHTEYFHAAEILLQ